MEISFIQLRKIVLNSLICYLKNLKSDRILLILHHNSDHFVKSKRFLRYKSFSFRSCHIIKIVNFLN